MTVHTIHHHELGVLVARCGFQEKADSRVMAGFWKHQITCDACRARSESGPGLPGYVQGWDTEHVPVKDQLHSALAHVERLEKWSLELEAERDELKRILGLETNEVEDLLSMEDQLMAEVVSLRAKLEKTDADAEEIRKTLARVCVDRDRWELSSNIRKMENANLRAALSRDPKKRFQELEAAISVMEVTDGDLDRPLHRRIRELQRRYQARGEELTCVRAELKYLKEERKNLNPAIPTWFPDYQTKVLADLDEMKKCAARCEDRYQQEAREHTDTKAALTMLLRMRGLGNV